MNKETFLTLSEPEQLHVLDLLFAGEHYECEIDYLLAIGLDKLTLPFLNKLARAYNNTRQEDKAMAILERIPEADRDAKWYYRYGYALTYKNLPARPAKEDKRQALTMFDKSVELASDEATKEDCLELVDLVIGLVFLEVNKTDFPCLYDYYLSRIPFQVADNDYFYDDDLNRRPLQLVDKYQDAAVNRDKRITKMSCLESKILKIELDVTSNWR